MKVNWLATSWNLGVTIRILDRGGRGEALSFARSPQSFSTPRPPGMEAGAAGRGQLGEERFLHQCSEGAQGAIAPFAQKPSQAAATSRLRGQSRAAMARARSVGE